MISAAVGRGGETMISAQTIEAFWNAVEHVKPIVGRSQLLARPGSDVSVPGGARRRKRTWPSPAIRTPGCRIRCRRRASIWSRRTWRRYLGDFARAGLINIAGGCCGNTPEHIAAIAKALEGQPPRPSEGGAMTTDPQDRNAVSETRIGSESTTRASSLRLAAVHAAAGRLHHDRRAHQRRRLAQVRQARSRKANTRKPSASRGSRSRTARTSSTSAWTRA